MSKKILNTAQVLSELKGASVFFPTRETRSPKQNIKKRTTSEVPNSRTTEVPHSRTSGLPEIRTYELRNYDQLRRMDIRITMEQKRFLSDLEERIQAQMPEGEANNPRSKRITKAAIIRVCLEIFRQLNLAVDASHFMNEIDMLQETYQQLVDKLTKSRTSELPSSGTS